MSTFNVFVYARVSEYCGSMATVQMHRCRSCSNTVAAKNWVAFPVILVYFMTVSPHPWPLSLLLVVRVGVQYGGGLSDWL